MYEEIVSDYLDLSLPAYVPREAGDIALPVPAPHNPVLCVVGIRGCGKTTLFFQLMNQLVASGVSRRRLLYVDFEDVRLEPDAPTCASDVLESYVRLVPEARDEGCYLFLDETSTVAGWQLFVRRITEHSKVTVVVAGSSTRLFSSEIPTQLRGRAPKLCLWPLSFREYCAFHGLDTSTHVGLFAKLAADALEVAFRDYLTVGGFPAVQGMLPSATLARTKALQTCLTKAVVRDVTERFGCAHHRVVRRLALLALRATGTTFSVNRRVKELRSKGVSVETRKAYAILDDLEDANLVFWASDYLSFARDNPRSARKAYAVDPGLALAVAPAGHLDIERRLETVVFLELMRRYGTDANAVIASYSAPGCPGVDFVAGDVELAEQYELVQVAIDIGNAQGTREERERWRREISSLDAAMGRCGLTRACVVTLDVESEIMVPSGTIEAVPCWKWCLQ